MSAVAPGTRVSASWLGGGFAPGTAVEVNPVTGLVKVRFDDGREAWVSAMNVRVAPAQTSAPMPSQGAPLMPPSQPGGFAPYAPPAAPQQAPAFGASSQYGAGGFNPNVAAVLERRRWVPLRWRRARTLCTSVALWLR